MNQTRRVCAMLFVGVGSSFIAGVGVAMAFGYTGCGEPDHYRRGCCDLYRRAGDRGGDWRQFRGDGTVDCGGVDQGHFVMVMTLFVAPLIGLNSLRAVR